MNSLQNINRWPPIYDFEELGQQINKLINDESIFDQFYELQILNTEFYQGDIINFSGNPIYIDKDGDVAIIDEDYDFWIILGNTCDLSRSIAPSHSTTFPHLTHISPLIPLPLDTPPDIVGNFKKYKLYKRIFIPNWGDAHHDYYIDLTMINSVERQCLIDKSKVVARLKYETWILLHSCLVRYLARDDGRND